MKNRHAGGRTMRLSGIFGIPANVGLILALICLTVLDAIAGPKVKEQAEPWRFAFGVEYMAPGLAEIYAAMGASWTKNAPNLFHWGAIEPNPPVGGKHTYDWAWPDMLIGEYQKAGFRDFHIYTMASNKWAMTKPKSLYKRLRPGGAGTRTYALKPGYLKDYESYIRSMVERYDCDGKDDMPGLLYPVRYWEIEAEWHTFWKGTTEEYLELLAVANKAVRQADPEGKIILVGFCLYDLFDGEPDQKEIEHRISNPRPPIYKKKVARKVYSEVKELLRHPELFDAIEFHALGDWTEIIGYTKFFRDEMKKHGYQKPIWAGDVNFSINPMIFWNRPYYPYVGKQKRGILKVLKAVDKGGDPQHDETVRWFRAEQASFTAKKTLCSIGEGLAGINMGNLGDIPFPSMLLRFTGSAEFCGLIDVKGRGPTTKQPRNWWAPVIPGQPRPAYWTMKLLIEKLWPYTATTRLSLGKGIYAWRCYKPVPASHKPASIVFIWYEDGKGQLPGDPEPEVNVSIPTKASSARLVRIITAPGKRTATEKPIAVNNGRIVLSVGETPLLIEEQAAGRPQILRR
jgi:hypothetical protein